MPPGLAASGWELFLHLFRIYSQDAEMKAILTSRPEIRWAAIAVPAVFVAHWMLVAAGPHLLALIPESVRTIFHLL